ncbi:helix-turn-helix domain-containing protein [Streptomyces sp. NPDC053429]|uniref:helix-turn-helix domain-containing protein n=1 Tax=Streptomyces sp. NPDC053429 TaxID=3365702 RepID=UPI0037D5CB3F
MRSRQAGNVRFPSAFSAKTFPACHHCVTISQCAIGRRRLTSEGKRAWKSPQRALAPGAAYAAALREAVSGFLTSGGTQTEIAKALHCSPSSLSRYLKGERVMPRESLRA